MKFLRASVIALARAAVIALAAVGCAQAQARGDFEDEAEEPTRMALGAHIDWTLEQAYGEGWFTKLTPGLVLQGYVPLGGRFFLRPAARASFTTMQPEMASSLKIRQDDVLAFGELGILSDGLFVPSLSVGYGVVFRSTKLQASNGVTVVNDPVSGHARFHSWRVALGAGLSLFQGNVVIEPHFFFNGIVGIVVAKARPGYGVDITFPLL